MRRNQTTHRNVVRLFALNLVADVFNVLAETVNRVATGQ
jgi:hypothetical protein